MLVVLALVCSLCLGLALFANNIIPDVNAPLTAEAAGGESNVTITADKTSVSKGGTIDLTITFTSTRAGAVWATATLFVGPLNASGVLDTTLNQYLSLEGTATGYDNEFVEKNYKFSAVDKFKVSSGQGAGYLNISVSAQSIYIDTLVPVTKPIVLKLKLKVSEDLPSDITTINIGSRVAKTNKVTTMVQDGQQIADVAAGATAVQGTLSIENNASTSVKEAGNDATLQALKLGGTAGTLSAVSAIADSMNWKGELAQGSVIVSPTANDANAKITVGTTANPTASVTSGGNSSPISLTNGQGTVYIKVTAEDGTTTKTYSVAVKNTYARLDGNVTDISTNSSTTGTKNAGFTANGKKFNDNTNAEQIYNVPSDATELTFRVRTKPNLGIASTVGVTASGCSISTNSLTGADGANGNTFKISNVTENSTVTLTTTAADGTTTYRYTIKFKVLSVDTSITDFYVIGVGQGNRYDKVIKDSTDTHFAFEMPSKSQYKGTFHITANESNAKITVDNAAYSTSTQYSAPSNHTVVVEAPAGNTKTYTVGLVKENIGAGKFTKLEFSKDGTTWIDVFTSGDYNVTNLEYTTNINLTEMAVGDRIYVKGTASSTDVTQESAGKLTNNGGVWSAPLDFGVNTFKLTAKTEGGSTVYSFVVNLVEDKNTIENIAIKDNKNTPIDSSKFTFSKGQTNYTLEVPNTVTSLTFDVTVDGIYTKVRTEREGILTNIAGTKVHNVTRTLVDGDNVFKIHAVSNGDVGGASGNGLGEDGTVYTITVTRKAASSDNKLKSLSVTIGGTVVDFKDNKNENTVTFDPNTDTYYVFSDGNATSATINAVANDADATVTGTGAIDLSSLAGTGTSNVITANIVVTAQNGDKKTYRIYIANKPITLDDKYDISSIRLEGIDGKDYFPTADLAFDPDITAYTVQVPNAINRIITYVEAVKTAMVHGDGGKDLAVGINTIEVWAVAQDGTTNANGVLKKYIFTVERAEANNNAYLKDISVNGKTVDGFDREKTDYSVRLPFGVNTATLRVEAEDPSAVISIFKGGQKIKEAAHFVEADIDLSDADITVTVTLNVAIDGTNKPYTVRLNKATAKPILTYLNVSGLDIYDGGFEEGNLVDSSNPDPEGLAEGEYWVAFGNSMYSLPIIARSSDGTAVMRIASYEGVGESEADFNVDALFGNKLVVTINIVIRPLVGEDSVYIVHLKRDPAPSSNTNAEIEIDELADSFNPEYAELKDEYYIYGEYFVVHTFKELNIHVRPEIVNEWTAPATYKIFYNRILKNDNGQQVSDVQLEYGVNIISIDIIASDNITKRTVGVVVVREDISMTSVNIAEIGDFSRDYSSDVDTYYYSISNGITGLTFDITMEEGLTYDIENEKDLKVGVNEIRINLYDLSLVNGRTAAGMDPVKTITLFVNREAPSNDLWMIFFWILLALVILELIIIIILAIVIAKKKKEKNNQPPQAPIVNIVQAPDPEPVPQPVVQQQPVQQIIQPMPMQQMPIQPVPMQPIQYVQQVPIQQMPVNAQPAPDPHRPVNVQVKITGMGENDGTYDQNGKR